MLMEGLQGYLRMVLDSYLFSQGKERKKKEENGLTLCQALVQSVTSSHLGTLSTASQVLCVSVLCFKGLTH